MSGNFAFDSVGLRGFLSTGEQRPLGVDLITQALLMLDYEHHEIHSGDHYFYIDSVELDAAATQVYLLTTPNTTKWIHFLLGVDHTAVAQIDLYEGADRIGTTLQTAFNNNRNSLNTPGLIIHRGISGGTTDGTLLLRHVYGFASGNSRTGGENRSSEEMILKQNTKYLLRLASSTADQLFTTHLGWYEHTNKT